MCCGNEINIRLYFVFKHVHRTKIFPPTIFTVETKTIKTNLEISISLLASKKMETVASKLINSSSSFPASPHTEIIFSSLSPPDEATAVTVSSCSGYSFLTHKLLLAAASPFLRMILEDTEAEELCIILPDYSSNTLQLLQQFIHKGELSCQSNVEYDNCQQMIRSIQLQPYCLNKSPKIKPQKPLIKNIKDVFNTEEIDLDRIIPNTIDDSKNNHNKLPVKKLKKSKNATRNEETITKHVINGKIEIENCDTCNSEFPNKQTYLKHKKTHPDESHKVVCDVCGGNYKDAYTLKVHRETQHLMVEKPFTCEVCGDKFKTKGSLKIHSSKHDEERAFVCEECGFQTKNKWLLKAHIKTHKLVKDFKCPHCPKTFNFQFILDKHIRIHTNERPYPCEICGTSFVSGIHLRRHKKSVHKPVRDFVCNICSAPFKRLSELKRHIILHTSDKPFECKICGETFKHREAGRRHSKAAHPGTTGNITFKSTESIGKLNIVAIKKLSPEEVAKAEQASSPQQCF